MIGSLQNRTLFITGGSRGIGKAIALRAAQDGANVAIAAKTDKPHPKLPGTIHTAAEEIEAQGGRALALKLDVRDEHAVEAAVKQAAEHFGGIDILVNNATFACSQAAIPYLLESDHPHILNLAPPPNLDPQWFRDHAPYTITKYGMGLLAMGMAEEFREEGIGVNSLWPRTVIATAAINQLGGAVKPENCRTEAIMADAAHWILTQDPATCTGNFFIDEQVLARAGVTDFDRYAVAPGKPLLKDLFL